MRKKEIKKSIFWTLSISTLCFIIYVFFLTLNSSTLQLETQNQIEEVKQNKETKVATSSSTTLKKDTVQEETITSNETLSQKATFSVLEEKFEFTVLEKMTVYDVMKILKTENKITFEGKEYSGLGFFVTSVNSLKTGGGKNLMYYVNDKEASVGISTYVIKEGDIIEWKLK